MADVRIRSSDPANGDGDPEVRAVLTQSWGSTIVVSRGAVRDAGRLPALIAERDDAVELEMPLRVSGGAARGAAEEAR